MEALIKQRIVEAAKEYSDLNYVDEDEEVPAFIEGADFALKNQWISVDESLPDDDENVFIMNEYGGCGYAHYDYNNKIWRMSSGCNADESDEIYSTITHWMEIPKNK